MRKELIETSSRALARALAPWAAAIIKVDGGYLAFESVADALAWRGQK